MKLPMIILLNVDFLRLNAENGRACSSARRKMTFGYLGLSAASADVLTMPLSDAQKSADAITLVR